MQFLHPQHILYRQKEQFSDGVGYSWIDGLKAFTEQQVIFLITIASAAQVTVAVCIS